MTGIGGTSRRRIICRMCWESNSSSEGQGLTEETIRACNGTVRIPMTDRVESLNAGIAGSILLWHFREESL